MMPWKVLGQKWHLARKGFPPGKPPAVGRRRVGRTVRAAGRDAPHGQFLWNNQQVVHVFVPEQREPWATIFTKRPAAVDLVLAGPKGRFALGRITDLAADREFQAGPERDQLRLRFATIDDLQKADLRAFVAEHLASLNGAKKKAASLA